jgi:hypothetical protein
VTFIVYEWEAWSQFKLVRAVPEAIRLTARPGEHAVDVLARCPPAAAAFAFHVNATFSSEFPHDRHDLVVGLEDRGIVPINAHVVNISKRWVQAQCAAFGLPVVAAASEGDPDERVIVKTNHNYGGVKERLLAPEQLIELGIPQPSSSVTTTRAYQILARRSVPGAWWIDPALAIERFIENRWGGIYRVGFAGRRFDVSRLTIPHAIKKVGDATKKVSVFCDAQQLRNGSSPVIEPAVGEAIVRFVEGAEMDYGALDVITDDAGRAYVLDVNTTPHGELNPLRRVMNIRRGLFELVTERAIRSGSHARPSGRGIVPTVPILRGEARRLVRKLRAQTKISPAE